MSRKDAVSTPTSSRSFASHHPSQQGGAPGYGAEELSANGSVMGGEIDSNPFRMPTDEEVFAMRDMERRRKLDDRDKLKNLRVHEKQTWSSRIGSSNVLRDEDMVTADELLAQNAPALPSIKPRNAERKKEKENLSDFISKKREMFLVQMALDTKRDEIRKLEEKARARENALKRSEALLEEDAARFETFLKENDEKAMSAIKKAEAEAKLKADKLNEIKKLNNQSTAIRSEMSKYEEALEECNRYKTFLAQLTPQEFLEEKAKKAEKSKSSGGGGGAAAAGKEGGKEGEKEGGDEAVVKEDKDKDKEDAEPGAEEMYFTHPSQLLEMFTALEESNLFLIQNCQEMEESLEELRSKYKTSSHRLSSETDTLASQIQTLQAAIQEEEDKAANLRKRAAKHAFQGDQNRLLEELHARVSESYARCLGEADSNLSTLEMLANIELKLEELFSVVETMPKDLVESLEKQMEKERREKARIEKMGLQLQQQQERIRLSILRSQAPIKKKTGKPVMFRSQPNRKKKTETVENTVQDDEDWKDFFT